MKIYVGANRDDEAVVEVEHDGTRKPLVHRVLHSPTGFSWGYCGSGPADLARSLLWDFMEKEPPASLYQEFKRTVIAKLHGSTWRIHDKDVANFLFRNQGLSTDAHWCQQEDCGRLVDWKESYWCDAHGDKCEKHEECAMKASPGHKLCDIHLGRPNPT